MNMTLSSIDFVPILPIFAIVVLFFILLFMDLMLKPHQKKSLTWGTAVGMLMIAAGSLIFQKELLQKGLIWGGLITIDQTGLIMIAIISLGTAFTALFASEEPGLREHGEFLLMLVAAAFGLSLMTISSSLIMLYLAMEMAGIPLYVMAGILIYNRFSTEAGLKYLIYGAIASAIMLYGFSLLFGLTGTASFNGIREALVSTGVPTFSLMVSILLILVGFGYKIAAVPFHFWAPDVYTGAPSSVSGFLSTVSKAAGFIVLLRFMTLLFPEFQTPMRWILIILAIVTMLAGNLMAIQQKNLKRLLAYSSIAHAGYLLVAVAAADAESTAGILYYLTGYLFTNLAAFALATAASRLTGSENIDSFSGISRRFPGLGLMFLITFLSLAGIPPFAGFAGKLFIFLAAAKSGLAWLVVIGLINSVIALYYYLNVLKMIYARPENEGIQLKSPQSLSTMFHTTLWICIAAILYFGVIYLPWYNMLERAASLLWS